MTSQLSNTPEWYCVRSQTKREHIAAEHLRELEDVEVFNPRLRYRRATRRGKVWWIEAMFPGYLLVKFNMKEMQRAVIYSRGVRGLVRFGSEIPPVPMHFIEAIKSEIDNSKDSEEDIITLTPDIAVGDDIEVVNGPFQGMHGTVISIPSASERIKILIDFLGNTQPVDVDLFSLLLPRRPVT